MNTYCVDKDIVLAEIMGQYLLVALKTAERKQPCTRQLNATGAFIWKMLEQKKSVSEIVKALCLRYELHDTTRVKQDLEFYMRTLCDAGYLILN